MQFIDTVASIPILGDIARFNYLNHQVKEILYVNAVGYIYSTCSISYKTQRKYNRWNVKDKPLHNLLEDININKIPFIYELFDYYNIDKIHLPLIQDHIKENFTLPI